MMTMTASLVIAVALVRRIVVGPAVPWVRFTPDGSWLVTSDADGNLAVWDAATGAHHAINRDGTVRLWDPASAKLLEVLTGHATTVWGALFSPDGHLVSFDMAGTAIVHDVSRDHRDAPALDRLVRCYVPYRLVDGIVTATEPDPSECR
jgi:WD40 repeat protein